MTLRTVLGWLALAIATTLPACEEDSASAASPSASEAAHGGNVDGAKARELVRQGALLLDVRTPEEFAAGHLPDAKNIPVGDLGQQLSSLDKTRPIVTYCQVGTRAARAASYLRAQGYTVHDLGSMSDW